MASTLQKVTEFSYYKTIELSSVRGNWQRYLKTAARIYKYPFRDQLLIHFQRPDATACATIEFWNKRMDRWVNRGTSGIALLDDSGPKTKLKYVFDVSDTHPGQHRPQEPQLWQMKPAYEESVLESISNSFKAERESNAPFAEQIISISQVIVEDNLTDYLEELRSTRGDSFLEDLDELNLSVRLKTLLANSLAYTLLTRCGYDADIYFDDTDFEFIHDFSTYETMSILGNASNSISKMVLLEIGRTVISLERSAKFAKTPDVVYDERDKTPPTERKERENHERTDLHPDRGLSVSRPVPAGNRGGYPDGQVRDAAQGVFESTQADAVRQTAAGRQTGQASDGHRPAGQRNGGTNRSADGRNRGRERGDEGQRSDELGGLDEQLQGIGGGDRSASTGLRMTAPEPGDAQLGFFEQLNISPQAEYVEPTSSAFFIAEKQLDVVLTLGGNDPHLRMMVALEYMKGKSVTEIAKRLPTLYRGSNGFNLDGAEISVWFDKQCIHIARGKTARFAPSRQVIAWETAAERIGRLLENGQFATNVELAEAPGYERSLLARQLWYLYHDFSNTAINAGYLPSLAKNPARGFPEETAWLAEQLDSPEFRQSLTGEYAVFQSAYQKNRNLLRFHHHKLQEISDGLHTLVLPRVAFSSALTEIPIPQQFITDDEIDVAMSSGSGIAGGKGRIFAFFQENHTEKEKADFLKHEYGLGGHSHALSGAVGSNEDHNGKGMRYQKDGCPEVRFTWEAVSKWITKLIRQDRYLTREEQVEYDKIQAEKALAEADALNAHAETAAQKEAMEKLNLLSDSLAAASDIIVTNPNPAYLPIVSALGGEVITISAEHVQADLPSLESAVPSVSLPVGRIDFLGTNGNVGESVEYTNTERFVAAIKEENYLGVPMRIVLYRDSVGRTIPQDFLKELDPPPQGFEITDAATRQTEKALAEAEIMEVQSPVPNTGTQEVAHDTDNAQSFQNDESVESATIQELYEQYKPIVLEAVTQDTAYQNACKHSDYANAALEGNAAINRAVLNSNNLELIRLYSDVPEFQRRLHKEIIEETYSRFQELSPPLTDKPTSPTLLRYTIRLLPNEGGITGIWDAALNRFYMEDGQILRFAEQDNAIAYLASIQKSPNIEQAGPFFSTPLGNVYRVGDRVSEVDPDDPSPYVMDITQVTEDQVWFTIINVPENPPTTVDRTSFERYLDTGYYSLVEDTEIIRNPGRRNSRYEVVVYHPFENGFDEKLDYPTLEEAVRDVQKYLDGSMEPDGFAYDGAAIYDLQEKRYLQIYGNFPDEKAQMQVRAQQEAIDLQMELEMEETQRVVEKQTVINGLSEQEQTTVRAMETAGFLFDPGRANPGMGENLVFTAGQYGYPVTFETWEQAYEWIDNAQLLDAPGLREQVQAILHPTPGEVIPTDAEYAQANLVPGETEFEQDGRRYRVHSIDIAMGKVELTDLTFVQSAGFPIMRIENIGTIRAYLESPRLTDPPKQPSRSPAATLSNVLHPEQPDTEKVAEYLSDQERIAVFRYPNGQFYNHYGYHEQIEVPSAVAGGFDTFEEAQATVYAHRPKAEKVLEPAEKAVDMARDTDSTVYGRIPDREMAPTLYVPRPRANVSSSILHPEQTNRHDYRIMDDALGVGTPSERYQNNIAAIRLLKQLERENRLATPEEQEILSQYVGWGGLADCFEETNRNYLELKSLLTQEEYNAARESTLTAFYTPPVVIRSMYQALEQMGFETGNILEPSCGTGNFLGMIPERMSSSKRYGIELDEISGQIARQLYQTASVTISGYEKTDLPDSFFDVAIGNIPFGNFKVADRRYNKHNFLIHDYFFGKTLDKVRPGGIVAFVTSKGTMDKENPAVRKYIAQRADLLGAIRLPNNTFKGAAGTEVTSDILFLQKRDSLVNVEPDWVHLGVSESGIKMNRYFIDHPEMILGEMQEVSGPYGLETACIAFEGQELSDLLTAAIGNIGGSIQEYERDSGDELAENHAIPADPTVRNFSYTIVDGEVYYRENSIMTPVEVSTTALGRIKGLIGLRDCVRQLIEYQTEDYPDHLITGEQQKLNRLYDAFVKKYGRIFQRANNSAFHNDSSYFLLTSLEVTDSDGNFVRKADMFSKRTIKQKLHITRVDTASEALALSLAEKAEIDISYMTNLTGKDEATLVEELHGVIFQLPGIEDVESHPIYVTADEYLSGNVRKKLRQAEQAADADSQFRVNVEALKAVQPVDLTASEISVRLGATWLPTGDVARFMFELFDTPNYARYNIKVHYSKLTGTWNIEGKSYDRSSVKANSTYGTNRINGYKIIEETLNLKDVRIFDYVEDAEGRKTAVLNKKETAIAQAKQQLIKQAFADWIWKDPERRERLCKLYNETFNSVRPREYDGSHLNFVGINPEIKLRPHQVNAIAHILYGGNTLLAHVVGAGKTFEIVAAAQESKRLGLCNKSLIAVPNHLTEQWATEYLQLYPAANILVATKKDFEPKNRKRFCGRIATGDYDAIIIGHSQLEKIPMSLERQRAILEEQLQEVLDGITDLKQSRGDNFSIKQMERTRKALQVKLDKLNDQSRKDDVVTFEELGVDRLFVDEAHNYKNLAVYTKMRNVGGIAQTEAQKSSDLYMKCRYLDELTGGHGVIFATGTPISNSMVEMYTMQKYLQHDTLRQNGLLHFDAWASTFGETVTAIELAPEGSGYRAKTRFAKFYNLPELMSMFKEVADVQTADMLNLPVPKANYHHTVLQPSEQQKEMVADLSTRAERVRNKMVDSSHDNMLMITNDGRRLALDQRMVNPLLPDSDTGKVSACADNIFAIWQRTAEQKSAQLAFCDLSTPKNDGTFNVYDDLRDKLIARGIPAEQIAYIHNANTEQQKKELFGKVCAGEVRVLLGSTAKMGAGTNVQKKLIALHHLDCPWRPADLQQREGRIIRQGNENREVEIYTYVTENTFDSYLYQLVESKQKFIGQIMTSKSPVRSAEDIDETALSYAEIKALCTGNPLIKEKMDLDIDVGRLKLLKANHLSQKYSLEDQIFKAFPQKIASLEQRIAGYQKDMAHLAEETKPNGDGFSPMVIHDRVYAEKKAAGSAILEECRAMTSPDPVVIGSYRGFSMELSFDTFLREYHLVLGHELRHTVNLGTDIYGNIQRMDNVLDGLDSRLKDCIATLDNTKVQLENARVEVEKPFAQEEELATKSARLEELNALLNMDEKDNELAEPSEDEMEEQNDRRTTRSRGIER